MFGYSGRSTIERSSVSSCRKVRSTPAAAAQSGASIEYTATAGQDGSGRLRYQAWRQMSYMLRVRSHAWPALRSSKAARNGHVVNEIHKSIAVRLWGNLAVVWHDQAVQVRLSV